MKQFCLQSKSNINTIPVLLPNLTTLSQFSSHLTTLRQFSSSRCKLCASSLMMKVSVPACCLLCTQCNCEQG